MCVSLIMYQYLINETHGHLIHLGRKFFIFFRLCGCMVKLLS